MPPKAPIETLPNGCTYCGPSAKVQLVDETDTQRTFRCKKCELVHHVHVDSLEADGGYAKGESK